MVVSLFYSSNYDLPVIKFKGISPRFSIFLRYDIDLALNSDLSLSVWGG